MKLKQLLLLIVLIGVLPTGFIPCIHPSGQMLYAQSATNGQAIIEGELGAQLDQAVQEATNSAFWGAVLVAKNGKILLSKGYGFADFQNRPNTPDTLFEIASVSKQFTAAAILKLESDGKLSTDDTLDKFFEGVPADKRAITVHQLVTHTSGISPNVGVPYDSPLEREAFAAYLFRQPLDTPPGSKFAYSNAAYSLLAAIIEKASGKSFETYMNEEIFRPIGMKDTGLIQDSDLDRSRDTIRFVPNGYVVGETAAQWKWSWGYRGMGGVVSTLNDLYRWERALRSDKILDEQARAKCFTPAMQGYAYGWFVRNDRGSLATHSGSVKGYRALWTHHLDEDVCVIILGNSNANPFAMEEQINKRLFPVDPVAIRFDLKDLELNEYKSVQFPKLEWQASKDGERRMLQLLTPAEESSGNSVAIIDMPEKIANGLVANLERAIEKYRDHNTDSLEAGFYLNPYTVDGDQWKLSHEDLKITLSDRYNSEEIITFFVSDSRARQWPILIKLGTKQAKSLLSELKKNW